jgi:hypothetical protein
MAVALTDRRVTTTRCEAGSDPTIYVFFDDQLVAQARTHGSVFSDTGIIVPGDAASGEHRFALSCTEARPWLVSAPFTVDDSANHPMGWITSLPRPGNLHNSPATWGEAALISGGLMALLLLVLGFPAEWFNDTYDANKERVMAAAHRRFPKLLRPRNASPKPWARFLLAPLLFLVFVGIAALFQGFLDPKFGWDPSSFWLFLGWCAGVAIVTLGFQAPAVLLGVRIQRRVRFQVLAGSIVVAAVCVVVSRALVLEPGYCYGLIAVFAFRPLLPEESGGRLAAVSALVVLALSVASYAAFVEVSHVASRPHPSPALLVVQAALGVVFALGIQSVSFGMLPLPFLPGRDVVKWNPWAWAGVFGLGTIAFVWILLQPGSGISTQIHHVDLIPVVVTCVVFAVVALAFMAYFKVRKPRLAAEAEEDAAPVGLIG